MHARKLPRISEPSFDKDYYDKGGGSSKLKYGRESRRSVSPDSSRSKSYSSSSRSRDHHHHSHHHHRDHRDHHRDHRDHHRDYSSSSRRHYHHRDYERSERYSGSSGGIKRSSSSWGSSESSKKTGSSNSSSNNHSNGHDVSSATGMTNNSEDSSKLKILGDWSEHISSSKRKYYYNCVTEVSQWEKPREWIEYEQQQQQQNSRSSRSSRLVDEDNRTSSSSSSSSNNGHSNKHSNNNNNDRRHYHENHHSSSSHHHRRKRTNDDHMEISSRDSTPVSEEDEGRMIDDVQTITPLSAALPSRVASHPPVSSAHIMVNTSSHNDTHEVVNNVVSTHDALKTIQSALLLTTTASTNSIIVQNNDSPYTGPPTPTHSEEVTYPIEGSVNSIPMQQVSQQTTAPSASSQQQQPPPLPSLSSLKPAAPSLPSLTPTLAKLYKDSLVSHVLGWPAEGIEKVCQRVNEEHTNISNLGITKVSADLKMARSLVRLAEIQATLQEQRILFLRQQSLDLDNMKLNSNLVQAASGPATLISSSLVNVSSSELPEIPTLVASSTPQTLMQ